MTREQKLEEALRDVRAWADSQCPCHEETPNPCTLCGASVENLEACKSVESIFPRKLLRKLDAALSAPKADAVTVKPLEWERFDTSPEAVIYVAQPVVGYYEAGSFADGTIGGVMPSSPRPDEYGRNYVKFEAESVEAAKAAAQADYEARILSAIDTSPVPALTDEAVERVARAWTSIDGKLVEFEDERKSGCSLMEEDTGTYEGYMTDAAELLRRSGLLATFPSKGEGE